MTSHRARVYRNVDLRQEWLGLEPFDAVGMGALGWLLMLVNRNGLGWNLVALMVAYAALRVAKRGKPEGYTTTLARYFVRRPFFSAAAVDEQLAGRPFLAPDESANPTFITGAADARRSPNPTTFTGSSPSRREP